MYYNAHLTFEIPSIQRQRNTYDFLELTLTLATLIATFVEVAYSV